MKGLVVEGGASRTYFAVGAMDVMMSNGISFDYIGGASAGISNAVNYASNQIGRGREIAMHYVNSKKYCGIRNFLNPKNRSLFGIDFVFKEIPRNLVPFDFDALKNFKGTVEATVTNVETGKSEYLPVTAEDRGFDVLIASCSLPIMFPIKEIGGKKYLDGGISDSIPFERALKMGCDKLVVILSRERSYKKVDSSEGRASLLFKRKYPKFAEALKNRYKMYNEQRRKLFELEAQGKAIVIEPEDTTGWTRTESDPQMLINFYKKGFMAAADRMDEIKNYLEENEK